MGLRLLLPAGVAALLALVPGFLAAPGPTLHAVGPALEGPPEALLPPAPIGAAAEVLPVAPLDTAPRPLPARVAGGEPLLCILDSGIDTAHVDLDGNKLAAWRDFVNNRPEPYDDNGHGTHVAGTAAGTGEADPQRAGAAPKARLLVGKVLDAQGKGTSSAAAKGIAWCVALGAKVINLSLEESDCVGPRMLADALADAARRDVLVIGTAGNRGEVPCAIHTPGSLGTVFTVGALAANRLDGTQPAGFSGRGSPGTQKPDLVAPGVGIQAASAGTARGLRSMDGTSMAAPYVAGVAALLRHAHPEAPASLVAEALRSTAHDLGEAGHDPSTGWGSLDPAAALAWLEARNPSPELRAAQAGLVRLV